jgi:hypothetical protein
VNKLLIESNFQFALFDGGSMETEALSESGEFELEEPKDKPKEYRIEDSGPSPSHRPPLKEEQKKTLEKLLQVDRSRLTPEEWELMQKLVNRLEVDSERIKRHRRQVEQLDTGNHNLDDVLSALRKSNTAFKSPFDKSKKQPGGSSGPSTEKAPAEKEDKPEAEQEPVRKAPLSKEKVVRPVKKPEISKRPRPWKSVVEKEEKKEEKKPEPKVQEEPAVEEPVAPPAGEEKPSSEVMETKEESVRLEPVEGKPTKTTQGLEPAAVVRRAIIAWNHKAFASEYECYVSGFFKMSKEDYVNRRMAAYLNYQKRGEFSQEMGSILRNHIVGDTAEVMCTRKVREFHRTNHYIDLYVLKKDNGRWRIAGVSSVNAQNAGPGGDKVPSHDRTVARPPNIHKD